MGDRRIHTLGTWMAVTFVLTTACLSQRPVPKRQTWEGALENLGGLANSGHLELPLAGEVRWAPRMQTTGFDENGNSNVPAFSPAVQEAHSFKMIL